MERSLLFSRTDEPAKKKQSFRHTCCPRLWTDLAVDPEGRVYACCHHKPRVLGNLYLNSLREIWNSGTAQEVRKRALSGKLSCFRSCNLVTFSRKKKPPFTRDTVVPYESLRNLSVLIGEKCNLRCRMCQQNGSNPAVLDADMLIRQVDLAPIHSVEIKGGEPLMMPEAQRFMRYAASRGKKIRLLTNGMLLNQSRCREIAQCAEFIQFSLNAASREVHEAVNRHSDWDRVTRNIRMMRAVRDQMKSACRLIGHMTVISENVREIPVFIATYADLGLDSIGFGYARHMHRYLFFRPGLRKHIAQSVRQVLQNGMAVNPHRLKVLGLL